MIYHYLLLCLELGCLATTRCGVCVTARLPRPRPSYAVAFLLGEELLVARAPQSLLDGFPVRNVARDRCDDVANLARLEAVSATLSDEANADMRLNQALRDIPYVFGPEGGGCAPRWDSAVDKRVRDVVTKVQKKLIRVEVLLNQISSRVPLELLYQFGICAIFLI